VMKSDFRGRGMFVCRTLEVALKSVRQEFFLAYIVACATTHKSCIRNHRNIGKRRGKILSFMALIIPSENVF
jgi:hypothetical protein